MRLVVLALSILAGLPDRTVAAQQTAAAAGCRATGMTVALSALPEASGIAVSRRLPGTLWSHNDSGKPVLIALDLQGIVRSRVTISGATVEDWEDVAVGPCPEGSCIYIADIGDNGASRNRVTIYRVPEPGAAVNVANVTGVFHATYPDGPRDAETLLISPEGRPHIVTKGEQRPIAIYRFPATLQSDATAQLERVGTPLSTAPPDADDRITGGSVSPDGRWIALRTHGRLAFYRAAALFSGTWREEFGVDVRGLKEPQGEGISLGADNTVYLAGEGGGGRPGTFARFACALPR